MKLSRWFLEIVIDLLTLEVLVPCLNLKRTKNHSHAISKFFEKSIHTSLCNSRNFCLYIKVWYLQKFTLSLSRFFGKNFVKATALLKRLLNSWFDEKKFQWEQIFHFITSHIFSRNIFQMNSQCGKFAYFPPPQKFFVKLINSTTL